MSVSSADPWQVKNDNIEKQEPKQDQNEHGVEKENGNSVIVETFEDNFTNHHKEEQEGKVAEITTTGKSESNAPIEPLPDSANYLQLLERKLQKVQKGAKLLDSLQQKKEDCMRSLLATDGLPASTLEQLLELDTPIESGRLQRHLLPIQAVTVGEVVHIVKHDALEEELEKIEAEQ